MSPERSPPVPRAPRDTADNAATLDPGRTRVPGPVTLWVYLHRKQALKAAGLRGAPQLGLAGSL